MPDRPLALRDQLATQIRANGPMSVAEYMALCLTHPRYGYYTTRDPLGAGGDFVTSPEISQMFGELIGLWMAAVWHQMGAPENIRVIELGPGRGTMMDDALRAAKEMKGFREAIVLRESRPLDDERMRRCAEIFLGEHDWSAFSSSHTDVESFVRTLRCLDIAGEPLDGVDGRLLTITAGAEGFVRYMVRGIVGALVAVGRGEVEIAAIEEALRSGVRPDRCVTVAAHGLTLLKVHYD